MSQLIQHLVSNIKVGTIHECLSWDFSIALISEFLATVIYMLIVCGACLPMNNDATLLHCALTTAFTIALLAHAFWDISGGHFNPVVSLGLMLRGQITILRCLIYAMLQVLGSFVGIWLLKYVTPNDKEAYLGALLVNVDKGVTVGSAFLLETVLTFFFIWIVHASTSDLRDCPGFQAPLAIGLSVGTSIMMAGPYHGCSLNPIRVVGPAVISGKTENHWIYWVAPIIGSSVSSIVFEIFLYVKNNTKNAQSKDINVNDRVYYIERKDDDLELKVSTEIETEEMSKYM